MDLNDEEWGVNVKTSSLFKSHPMCQTLTYVSISFYSHNAPMRQVLFLSLFYIQGC